MLPMNMKSVSYLLMVMSQLETWVRDADWEIIMAWNFGNVLSLNA
jgi:hypothetical protein